MTCIHLNESQWCPIDSVKVYDMCCNIIVCIVVICASLTCTVYYNGAVKESVVQYMFIK